MCSRCSPRSSRTLRSSTCFERAAAGGGSLMPGLGQPGPVVRRREQREKARRSRGRGRDTDGNESGQNGQPGGGALPFFGRGWGAFGDLSGHTRAVCSVVCADLLCRLPVCLPLCLCALREVSLCLSSGSAWDNARVHVPCARVLRVFSGLCVHRTAHLTHSDSL